MPTSWEIWVSSWLNTTAPIIKQNQTKHHKQEEEKWLLRVWQYILRLW